MNYQCRLIFILIISILTVAFCEKSPTIPDPITSDEEEKIPFDKLSGKIVFKRTMDERPDEYFFMQLDANLNAFTLLTTLYLNIPANLMLSPDGTQITFSYFIFKGQIRGFLWQMYVLDIESQTYKNIAPSLYDDSYGAWSPNGKKIAFWSDRYLESSIWLVDLELDSSYHLVDVNSVTRSRPAWFSDGENLVYASADSNFKASFYQLSLVTSTIQKLYTEDLTISDMLFKHPDISPDDRYLVFVKSYKGKFDEIWILNLQNKVANQLTTGYADWHPCWSPDGQQLLFSRGKYLFVIDKDGSDLTQVTFGDHLDEYPSWIQ